MKQPRVVWTREMKQRFEDVYNHLGHDNATPKKILELMNEPGLTHKNVNSHLQKYRLHLRRLGVIPQGKRYMNRSSSTTVQDQNLVPLPAQNLPQFQSAGLVQPRMSGSPLMGQRSISNFGNPTITFGDGDRQMMMMMNNGSTQMLNEEYGQYMRVQHQSTGVWPGPNVQSSGQLLPVADQPSMLPSLEQPLDNVLGSGQNQEQGVAEALICLEQYFQDLINPFPNQVEEDNPLGGDEFNLDDINLDDFNIDDLLQPVSDSQFSSPRTGS